MKKSAIPSLKKSTIKRYEHELIITLLIILFACVIALLIIVNNQQNRLTNTAELIEILTEEKLNNVD